MRFNTNSKPLPRFFRTALALLTVLVCCLSFKGVSENFLAAASAPHETGYSKGAVDRYRIASSATQHVLLQSHFQLPRASEHAPEFIPGDAETNDDDAHHHDLLAQPPDHHLHAHYISHSFFNYRSLDDRTPIPLYTLHHSWKSFLC